MTWQGALEHHGLLVIANRLVDELCGLRRRLQHTNDIEYAQHGDCADRARNLAEYLRAAVLAVVVTRLQRPVDIRPPLDRGVQRTAAPPC
jgi:hypothetical protein